MIIDSHAHLVPPSLLDAVRANVQTFASLKLTDEGGFVFADAKPTRPISKPLSDVAGRLRWMDEQHIDAQMVGGWVDMFGYELPVEEGVRWSRLINAHFVSCAKEQPRFIPLATLPMQHGASAAQVLREAHGQGFRGAMIGTQPRGRGSVLDDPDLLPFWEAADALGSVVLVHPVFDCGDDRVHDYGMANAVGRVTDLLLAMSRLIYSGHVTRFRNAKIVACTGGAALPYVVGRLRRNYELDKDKLGNPDDALAALYYDSIVHDRHALRFMADRVGADRIMMGSDMPFPIGDLKPMAVVEAAGFSAEERASINGGLAQRLMGL